MGGRDRGGAVPLIDRNINKSHCTHFVEILVVGSSESQNLNKVATGEVVFPIGRQCLISHILRTVIVRMFKLCRSHSYGILHY